MHAHAHELNFENGQFDAIVAVNTLKLLPEPRIALESWQRVLKPGGRLIVVCDALDSADTQKFLRAQEQTDPSALVKYYVQMRDNLPMWHGDSAEMRALLEIAGFENVVQTGLAGQLAREGKWRFQQYSAGYSVFSADNPGSIPLTTL